MSTPTPMSYTSAEVMELADVSYRQLDYWCRIGLIPGQSAVGSGRRRTFTPKQVERVRRLARASDLRGKSLADLADAL